MALSAGQDLMFDELNELIKKWAARGEQRRDLLALLVSMSITVGTEGKISRETFMIYVARVWDVAMADEMNPPKPKAQA